MENGITTGSIWIEDGVRLTDSLPAGRGFHSSGWTATNGTRSAFEKELEAAGWTLFFMAGEIKATVFGFDSEKTLATALKQLIANVKAQNFNGIEITQVTNRSFLKVPYVSVTAHARHLQMGTTFSGLR
jgi:hypothetical protein